MSNTGKEWPLMLVRRGWPGDIWWQEMPDETTAAAARSVGWKVVPVVPVSTLEALAQELEERAEKHAAEDRGNYRDGRLSALNEAAKLVRAKIEEGGK
jgi:hypothetical protein